jgi:predicted dehydrogenase
MDINQSNDPLADIRAQNPFQIVAQLNMENSRIVPRVALIGCGRWGRNIARVLSRVGALELIVDPAAATLQPYAEELGARVVVDIESAFGGAIDAIVIAAPAVDHAWLARRALEAGKPVFVEKPLALDLKDANDLAALAEERSLTLMVGHLLQYHPAYQKLKELVGRGEIGDLRHITSHRLNSGAIRTEENALWSMAPHDFSMVLGLTGKMPTDVAALPVRVVNPEIPDQFFVQLRFSETLTAQINVSWISPEKEHKLTVLGTRGALVFEDTAADPARKLVIHRDYVDASGTAPRFVKGVGESVPYSPQEPLENELRSFLAAAGGGPGNYSGPSEAIPVLTLLCKASEAAAKHG